MTEDRFKLIPTRGRKLARLVYDRADALAEARAWHEELETPVMVVSAPVGGIVTPVETVGGARRRKR